MDKYPGIFLHPSIFSIIHSRAAKIMNNALSDDDDDDDDDDDGDELFLWYGSPTKGV